MTPGRQVLPGLTALRFRRHRAQVRGDVQGPAEAGGVHAPRRQPAGRRGRGRHLFLRRRRVSPAHLQPDSTAVPACWVLITRRGHHATALLARAEAHQSETERRGVCRGEGKSRDESLIRTLAYLCDSVDHVRYASFKSLSVAGIATGGVEGGRHASEALQGPCSRQLHRPCCLTGRRIICLH